ncbi:MAG: alanine racemase, partial [Deltaproteobacteria bacterium]|nr:alanine racemase [Deltaproteobacteria bacterium]
RRDCVNLKPVMALKSRVTHVKRVPAGFKVSYGSTYEAINPTVIATVSIGYSDGLNRLLSSKGHMLLHGCKAPIAGRVCMDMTMLDAGNIPDVRVGDEVVVFGEQGDASITVDRIAKTTSTINYEVVTGISGNLPRIINQE